MGERWTWSAIEWERIERLARAAKGLSPGIPIDGFADDSRVARHAVMALRRMAKWAGDPGPTK